MTHRLVMIEWHDSRRPIPEWSYVDDLPEFSPVVCRSVGWLIHDGADVKAVAPNMGDLGSERTQMTGAIQIPTRCIVSISDIEPKGALSSTSRSEFSNTNAVPSNPRSEDRR